jgi:hypothetical protein
LLVGRDLGVDECPDFNIADRLHPRFLDDVSSRKFTCLLVRDSNNSSFSYSRMGSQNVFKFSRSNLKEIRIFR